MDKKITYEELEQALKDIEESIEAWRFYIKNGADNGSFTNEINNLKYSSEYFIKLIKDFANQCTIEEMERIEKSIF